MILRRIKRRKRRRKTISTWT